MKKMLAIFLLAGSIKSFGQVHDFYLKLSPVVDGEHFVNLDHVILIDSQNNFNRPVYGFSEECLKVAQKVVTIGHADYPGIDTIMKNYFRENSKWISGDAPPEMKTLTGKYYYNLDFADEIILTPKGNYQIIYNRILYVAAVTNPDDILKIVNYLRIHQRLR